MQREKILFGLILIGLIACEKERTPIQNPGSKKTIEWLIDAADVLDGGPGKDGIPALENPEMIEAFEADYLSLEDLVIGYKYGDEVRAYPHKILDYHEIANDDIDDNLFAITYCPLTGTATNWNRRVEGLITTFGVSGLLFNSNLMPYDRGTESLWSQMRLDCVNGTLLGSNIPVFHTVETTWHSWKKMYPNTKVMSTNTGYNRNYEVYPYSNGSQDYREVDFLVFPVKNIDNRLHTKERVLGLINNEDSRAYRFELFTEGISVVEDVVGGEKVAIIGSKDDNFMIAFFVDDQILEPLGKLKDGFVKDQNENIYDPFGYIISGPNMGERLKPTNAYIGYWFSWPAFYPDIEIFGE